MDQTHGSSGIGTETAAQMRPAVSSMAEWLALLVVNVHPGEETSFPHWKDLAAFGHGQIRQGLRYADCPSMAMARVPKIQDPYCREDEKGWMILRMMFGDIPG